MIPTNFRPNLAATLTKPEAIQFPVFCSPKIDGIRCVVFRGAAYSRSLKLIPNAFVQAWAAANATALHNVDGELVVGNPTDMNCMQNSMSVMRKSGEPEFSFYAFDIVYGNTPYQERWFEIAQWAEYGPRVDRCTQVRQYRADTLAALDVYEAQFLNDGYEGMMIRRPGSLYKFGRSTEKEGGLTKVKRFTDAEAEVIGFEEEMFNGNTADVDNFGRTKRSTVSSGLSGKGTLGALRCRTAEGIEFNIGTGFTAAQREQFWHLRSGLVGQLVTYKSFGHGVKTAPRHPVYKAFRHPMDMS